MPLLAPAPSEIVTDPTRSEDLTPTRAHLGDSGIVVGATDAYGIRWIYRGDEPWSPSPAPREQTGDRIVGHGTWDATEFYGPAMRALSGIAEGSHAALHAAKERLKGAVSVRPFLLRIIEPGFDRWAMVRRGGEVLWTETDPGSADWSISLYQPDPLIYAAEPYQDFTYLPQQSGGLSWPAKFPAVWDAHPSAGELAVFNAGNQPSAPVFRVYGPLSDFTLSVPGTSAMLTVDLAADGESLAEGEWSEVDMRRHRVMLLGQSSRRRAVRGGFFELPPGQSSVLFGSTAVNDTAFVTVEGYSTWI